MGIVRPEQLQQLQLKWQDLLNSNEGEKIKKIICIDGKTMCSNKRGDSKPNHIVSAWSREDGYCLGQRAVEEKSNEITAIPEVLDVIEIKGQVVTFQYAEAGDGAVMLDPEGHPFCLDIIYNT
jgi:hypothetical protein